LGITSALTEAFRPSWTRHALARAFEQLCSAMPHSRYHFAFIGTCPVPCRSETKRPSAVWPHSQYHFSRDSPRGEVRLRIGRRPAKCPLGPVPHSQYHFASIEGLIDASCGPWRPPGQKTVDALAAARPGRSCTVSTTSLTQGHQAIAAVTHPLGVPAGTRDYGCAVPAATLAADR
jgi:hypothetical protein